MSAVTIVRTLVALALAAVTARADAASTSELLRCQKLLHTRATSVEKTLHLRLSNCALQVETCQLAQEIDGTDPTSCLASAALGCAAASAKVLQSAQLQRAKAQAACAVPLAELEQAVAGLGFAGVNATCASPTSPDLLACVFDAVRCAAERTLFALDPRAQDALTAAGIAAAHPCVAP
jgi:hypothetical protein